MEPQKPKYLLILNPIAGDTDKSVITDQVDDWENAFDIQIDLYRTTGNNDFEVLEKQINGNEKALIAAGGDGTITMVAQLAIKHKLPLAILPAGSANGLAKELGIPNVNFGLSLLAKNQLTQQLENIVSSTPQAIDVVYINDHLMLHLADFGVNAGLIRDFEAGDSRGFLGYAQHAIDQLKALEPFEFTIQTDEHLKTGKAIMLAFANAQRYGTGAVINPKGKLNDGHFEIVIVKDISLKNSITSLSSIITGEAEYDQEEIEIISLQKALIQLETKTPFQVDGEYIGELQALQLQIKPNALQIIAPYQEN